MHQMFPEADTSMTSMALEGGQSNPDYGNDTLLVKFFKHAKQDAAASLEAGRPIFNELVYVEKRIPGNRDSVIRRPIYDKDKQEFPRHYAAFLAREDQATVSGTPLGLWPGVSTAQVEELKHFNVCTLEQLVGMPDSQSGQFMGLATLRKKAGEFLAATERAAPVLQHAEELEAQKRENARLQAQIDELVAQAGLTGASEKTAPLDAEVESTTRRIPRKSTRNRG